MARHLPTLAVAAIAVTTASSASATPPLHTPFPCGTTYGVTQGHNTGSHTDYGSWAWDIGIPAGGEVASPADGVIRSIRMDSTSGGCSDAYADDANYVVVDFQDGTEALFLHLQTGSSSLQVGDLVKQGDVVGAVGLTGWVCGAHLHFQIQQTCTSPWWCPSIPASFVDYGDPGLGATLMSNNCPPLDPCPPLAGGEAIVDERTTCFQQVTSFWWSEPEGWDDHHYYTFGIDAAESDTVGTWWLEVEVPGRYQVDAHVPAGAQTTGARYFADPGSGRVELAVIDQSAGSGWVPLGELEFTAGSDRYVELGDATGEAPGDMVRVAFDALRFSYVEEGGGSGTGGAGAGGQSAGVGGQAPTSGSGGASTSGGLETPETGADDREGGCGCRTGSSEGDPRSTAAWLVLALGLAVRRRR